MSKALSAAAAMAGWLAQQAPPASTQPAGASDSPYRLSPMLVGLSGVGAVVLAVYAIRRLARPTKLQLALAPGRPNRLHPAHVVALYAFYVLAPMGAGWLLSVRFDPRSPQLQTLAGLAGQILWLGASLAVAAATFDRGLVRGMGLSLRHWFYDLIRGAVGYLAVLPVCVLLAELAGLLLPVKEHRMLLALHQVSLFWQVLVILSAVLLAPLAEEVFFRGMVQSLLRQHLPPWTALLITSAVFAMVHMEYPSSVPAMFALSVVLGYNYERCGRLLAPILIHALFNAVFIVERLTNPA